MKWTHREMMNQGLDGVQDPALRPLAPASPFLDPNLI